MTERGGGPGSYRGVTATPGSAFQPLLGARALADWIRRGGRSSRAPLGYALRLRWHARLFELNWRTQLERMPRATAIPATGPLFILGLWRSGTTVLHELVNACGGWVTPQTWQCFHPSTCFLTGPPAAAPAVQRPMDRGLIATAGPQEDEFALLLLGEHSLYRGLIDPRRLPECAEASWSGAADGLERWQRFLQGLAAGGEGRLLLKSPGHSFRIPALRRLFPGARFIWIGRHPGEVLASNVRMWRAMMGVYALWDCPDDILREFLRGTVSACSRVLEQCVAEMTREQMLWVDFESLQTDPERVLRQILQFSGDRPGHGAGSARETGEDGYSPCFAAGMKRTTLTGMKGTTLTGMKGTTLPGTKGTTLIGMAVVVAALASMPMKAAYAYIDPNSAGALYQFLFPLLVAVGSAFAFLRRTISRACSRFAHAVVSIVRGDRPKRAQDSERPGGHVD